MFYNLLPAFSPTCLAQRPLRGTGFTAFSYQVRALTHSELQPLTPVGRSYSRGTEALPLHYGHNLSTFKTSTLPNPDYQSPCISYLSKHNKLPQNLQTTIDFAQESMGQLDDAVDLDETQLILPGPAHGSAVTWPVHWDPAGLGSHH